MPYSITSRQWVPDSGAPSAIAACGGLGTCKLAVVRSGWLEVTASLNGTPGVKVRAHVSVVPCPSGDSLVDDPRVRAGLRRLWNAMNPTDPQHSHRREIAGWVYYDPVGDTNFIVVWPNPNDSSCSSFRDVKPPGAPPDSWIIAGVHGHPFANGDSLPVSCKGPGYEYSDTTTGGPSLADWLQASQPRAPTDSPYADWRKVPEYIIDSLNVIFADTNVSPLNWKSAPKKSRVGPNQCKRV